MRCPICGKESGEGEFCRHCGGRSGSDPMAVIPDTDAISELKQQRELPVPAESSSDNSSENSSDNRGLPDGTKNGLIAAAAVLLMAVSGVGIYALGRDRAQVPDRDDMTLRADRGTTVTKWQRRWDWNESSLSEAEEDGAGSYGEGDGQDYYQYLDRQVSGESSKKKYVIYSSSDQFAEILNGYYTEVRDEELWDGVEIEWNVAPNYDGEYQSIIRTLLSGEQDNIGAVPDLVFLEPDFMGEIIDSGGLLDFYSDLGLEMDDTRDMYGYTLQLGTSDDGGLRAIAIQADPGMFIYNKKYAREILGTDDPEQVQQWVKDWESFEDTAYLMRDSGVKMVYSAQDISPVFISAMSRTWTDAYGETAIPPEMEEWAKLSRRLVEGGCCSADGKWYGEWYQAMEEDGGVFGYFLPGWGINFVMDAGLTEDWDACEGPQSYYYGGVFMGASAVSDNTEITADIVRKLACSSEFCRWYAEEYGQFMNNAPAMKEIAQQDHPAGSPQSYFKVQDSGAAAVSVGHRPYAYESTVNALFENDMKAYILGTADYEEAEELFFKDVGELS
ncbi:MAG: carbohydrate ABC transporter substrate-binding protein [Ruminococcus sp.]|nr:carbohydrate ABC transporter substrate-binding protein [Ruminococcus sp.]